MPRQPKGLAKKVRQHLRAKGLGKQHYERADTLLNEILLETVNPSGLIVKLRKEKKLARLVNNFVDKDGKPKNVAYRQHGIKQFEFKVEEA